jgi:hypothetical protein
MPFCPVAGPGSQPTVKCPTCKFWSHRDCVGNLSADTCLFCRLANGVEGPPRLSPGPQSHIDLQKDFIKPQAQPSLPNPSLLRKKKSQSTSKAKKGRMQDSDSVDYDKQCGVINDKNLPCSHSLACKDHSSMAKVAVRRIWRRKCYDAGLSVDYQQYMTQYAKIMGRIHGMCPATPPNNIFV